MTWEEKEQFGGKLFREADEIGEKITQQIAECEAVRGGMLHKHKQTARLIEDYNNTMDAYNQGI